jgi:hypothetical protein
MVRHSFGYNYVIHLLKIHKILKYIHSHNLDSKSGERWRSILLQDDILISLHIHFEYENFVSNPTRTKLASQCH